MQPRVDVVIPVHNAAELARRCIESVYARIGHRIADVYVHDNASQPATARMLDALSYSGLRVYHATLNSGFGQAVNEGIAQTSTALVLVLNSDIEARDDFLSPLLDAMARDERLAAVTPSGNSYCRYEFARYATRAGCVVTFNLPAYAFVVRRQAFREAGGFDPAFGLGFYEDADLSRRLLSHKWWMGIHPGSSLHHEVHGSFREIPGFRGIMHENRRRYFARHPRARREIFLVTGESDYGALPAAVRSELEEAFVEGGEAYWVSHGRPTSLPALELRPGGSNALSAVRLFRRRCHKRGKRLSELWLTRDATRSVEWMLERLADRHQLPVRRF